MVDSSDDKKTENIIIKKVKRGHDGHHGGAWKVAYADFVTAMMAFFLVLWMLGQSEEAKEAVGKYFRDPSGAGVGSRGAGILKSSGASPIKLNNHSELRRRAEEQIRQQLSQLGENIRRKIHNSPDLSRFEDLVDIAVTEEGLLIQLTQSANKPFFRIGSSELEPAGETMVRLIGRELGRIRNHVVIEGHTDALKYSRNADYTNWELSADRANTARRVLLEGGLKKDQIVEIRGVADRRPKIKINPADPRNRRIAILVLTDVDIYRYSDTLMADIRIFNGNGNHSH